MLGKVLSFSSFRMCSFAYFQISDNNELGFVFDLHRFKGNNSPAWPRASQLLAEASPCLSVRERPPELMAHSLLLEHAPGRKLALAELSGPGDQDLGESAPCVLSAAKQHCRNMFAR